MIPMSVADIAEAVGGRLSGVTPEDAARLTVTGPPVPDSRQAAPGCLFVADGAGHDFAGDAVARGAVAVLCSRPLPGLANVPAIVAPDPGPGAPSRDASVIALGRLATHVVGRLSDLTIVALTGSSGKTGTKDLLAQVLSHAGRVVAPEASLNDELGMPLTALQADTGTRFLVLEMGARGIGHLTYLTGVVRPDIGIVLNVGTAHAGGFGGKEGIAQAKGELIESLAPTGTAVLNADDPLVRAMAARTKAHVVFTGVAEDADVRATEVSLDPQGRASFLLQDRVVVRLRTVGEHQVGNALAVAAVGTAVGMDLDTIAEALSTAERRARWRMEVTDRSDGVTIVNDAYNANPDSMRAALRATRVLAGDRRTWAVLGEMLELGSIAESEHETVGKLVVELGFDRVIAVGGGAEPIVRAASDRALLVADRDAAEELLRTELRNGDVVLVKSSRDAGLRWLGDDLARAALDHDDNDREAPLTVEEGTG